MTGEPHYERLDLLSIERVAKLIEEHMWYMVSFKAHQGLWPFLVSVVTSGEVPVASYWEVVSVFSRCRLYIGYSRPLSMNLRMRLKCSVVGNRNGSVQVR